MTRGWPLERVLFAVAVLVLTNLLATGAAFGIARLPEVRFSHS